MATNLPPRDMPVEAVRLGRWPCIVCGVEKPVAADGTGGFPTGLGPDGRDWYTECRACRDKRWRTKGGNGDAPPWTPVGHRQMLERQGRLPDGTPEDEDDDDIGQIHHEGKEAVRRHKVRERDPKLRRRKIKEVKRKNGKLACQACDVEIEAVYRTPDGQVYECHHLVPLAVTGETVNDTSDVVLLCPTCHRASHRLNPWPTLKQMRALHRTRTRSPTVTPSQ